MDIDDLTYGELKKIAALFSVGAAAPASASVGLCGMIGQKRIIRTFSAGVWFGEISEKSGNEVIVKNARRLWRWAADSSVSLSAVAVHGVDAKNCKFAPAVAEVWLEAIELIECKAAAISSIEGVADVKAA